jgi:hypothetical protein
MNGCVIESSEAFDWGAGTDGRTFKISKFAATDMLLWEPEEVDHSFNDGSSSPGDGLCRRHNTGAIFGLIGGHARYIKWDQYYKILADPNKNELYCFPNSDNGR